MRTSLSLTAVLLPLCVATAHAQQPGSPHNCHGLYTAVLAGGAPHREMRACAPFAIPEIAEGIRNAANETDPDALLVQAGYTALFRDPAVFDAALALAANAGATGPARAYGLVQAFGQVHPGITAGPSFRDAVHDFRRACVPEFSGAPAWWVDNGVSADADSRLRSAMEAIRHEPTATAPTGIAECLGLALGPAPVRLQDVSGHVHAKYLCPNEFSVSNHTPMRLELIYRVPGTSDMGSFALLPNATQRLITEERGQVDVLFQGVVIASARDTGDSPCSAPN